MVKVNFLVIFWFKACLKYIGDYRSLSLVLGIIRWCLSGISYFIAPQEVMLLGVCLDCSLFNAMSTSKQPFHNDGQLLVTFNLSEFYKGNRYPHQELIDEINNRLQQYYDHDKKVINQEKASALLNLLKIEERKLARCLNS